MKPNKNNDCDKTQQVASSDTALAVVLDECGVRNKIRRGCRKVLRYLGLGNRRPGVDTAHIPDFGFSRKSKRYNDRVEITRGGMGAINCAYDTDLKRQTAMKVALPAILCNPINASRFVNEARTTAGLEHPNIVPVHDIGVSEEDGLYYTMKLVAGESLNDIIDNLADSNDEYLKKFNLHKLTMIFHDVCEAIAFAHSRGVLHLDIKPENIMIGEFGEVLLMDWGISQYAQSALDNGLKQDDVARQVRAVSGEIRGTPVYMSPEQARGDSHLFSELTDVFLLGATLYHMLTLCTPHERGTPKQVLERAGGGEPVKHPAARSPERQLPDEICRICMKAMAPAQNDRYQSATELIQDVEAFLGGRILSHPRTFQPGETLMNEGDPGTEAYVIISGKVDIVRHDGDREILLNSLGPGDTVGEMALISHGKRSATVIAREATTVQTITPELMRDAMTQLPPWFANTVAALTDRLRQANEKLSHETTNQHG